MTTEDHKLKHKLLKPEISEEDENGVFKFQAKCHVCGRIVKGKTGDAMYAAKKILKFENNDCLGSY